jgi:hypothetical protein
VSSDRLGGFGVLLTLCCRAFSHGQSESETKAQFRQKLQKPIINRDKPQKNLKNKANFWRFSPFCRICTSDLTE